MQYGLDFSMVDKEKYSIAVDWFQVFCEKQPIVTRFENGNMKMIAKGMPKPDGDETVLNITDEIVLVLQPVGTSHYAYSWKVFYMGEAVAFMQTHPRKPNDIFTEHSVAIKMENHLLYTRLWLEIFNSILDALHLEVRSVTRLDIAIDGVGFAKEFLNYYQSQRVSSQVFFMKGKAKFVSRDLNKHTMQYGGFQIGSGRANKYVTFYNKTSELEVSNKLYIKEFWYRTGLPMDSPVHRIELRLQSEEISRIKDFDINELANPNYLASLFFSCCQNFFEFVYKKPNSTETKLDRMPYVRFINWDALGAESLDFGSREVKETRYKAKLALHMICRDYIMGVTDVYGNALDKGRELAYLVVTNNLGDYLSKRLPFWQRQYEGLVYGQGKSSKSAMELLGIARNSIKEFEDLNFKNKEALFEKIQQHFDEINTRRAMHRLNKNLKNKRRIYAEL